MVIAALCECGFISAESDSVADQYSPPNFLFILADDLGWSDLGCYGNSFLETPNIDRLSEHGMRFTDAYAAAPVCSPTRASILSGMVPNRFGLFDFLGGPHNFPWTKLRPPENRPMPLQANTLPEVLSRAGYVSCHIGKWHVGNRKQDQGFVSPPLKDEVQQALPEEFTRELEDFVRQNPQKSTGPLTEEAVRFLAARRHEHFLCYVSYYAVHIPCQARRELVEKYQNKAMDVGTMIEPTYAAMAQAMDESVGYLLKALELLELAENTIVIFFSDNGGLFRTVQEAAPRITANSPLRGQKGQLYEGGIRVPLIVRWPGMVKANSLCRVPVISHDLYPTLLEIAGLSPDHAVDGVSLSPLWRGSGRLERNTLYWFYPAYHHSTPAMAVRERDLKLIEFLEDGRLELYDLSRDLGEKDNLAKVMPEKASELRDKLTFMQKSIGVKLADPNPDYDVTKANVRIDGEGNKHRIDLSETW